MTNPFAPAATADAAPAAPTFGPGTAVTPPVATEKTESLGFSAGDPFASPTGVSGEYIQNFVGNLLLVKPIEVIAKKETTKGICENAVLTNLAILDDANEPGRIVNGVLLLQTALKREAKEVYDNPAVPYLLGRLHKREEAGKNTLYTFQSANDDEKNLARQFLASGRKL